MKLIISVLSMIAGGGVIAPIVLASGKNTNLSNIWTRQLEVDKPLMDCKGAGYHYQIKLAFDEKNATGDALYDLFFDVIDANTGNRIDQLGQKFKKGEKFQLIISGAKGRVDWGVALQSTLINQGTLKGDWSSLNCQENNFEVVGKSCNEQLCQETEDFKNISFEWADDKEEVKGWIRQGILIKAVNNLKWKEQFKPKATFSNK